VLVIGGVIVLASRRLPVRRVRATTAPVDYVTLILLLTVIPTGIAPTIGINLLGHGYDYRTTVAPWFRGLFIGSPDVRSIAHAPLIYQLHATAAWMIWGLWPFSRLVHAWSYPLWYLWRPYIVYRSRHPPRRPSRVPADANGARSAPRSKRIEPRGVLHRPVVVGARQGVITASRHQRSMLLGVGSYPARSQAAAPPAHDGGGARERAFSMQDGTVETPVLDAGLGNDMRAYRARADLHRPVRAKEAHGEECGGTGAPGL
jgi:hypothetical protein